MMHLKKLRSSHDSLIARPSSEVMTCIQTYDDKEVQDVEKGKEEVEDTMNQQMSDLYVDVDLPQFMGMLHNFIS